MKAKLDSEIPRAAASSVNRCLSVTDTRAVMTASALIATLIPALILVGMQHGVQGISLPLVQVSALPYPLP